MTKESLEERGKRVVAEDVEITPYNPAWPSMFKQEKAVLLALSPKGLIRRVEHFGSTAVPGLAAKPIVDMLVEVASLEETKEKIAPLLEAKGYDYFWRPSWGDDTPPFYAWFIKRGPDGCRTHHIHMVERDFDHWNRLYFRDYLIENKEIAEQYQELKLRLAREYPNDRVAYTKGKTEFILETTRIAKEYYARAGK
jgi:GrpB-like predicted nucleotidyltransferase (UPF0157 family)